jgi:DNA-binding MarR family transcriptional regulator
MQTTTEILTIIEEQETHNIKQLAKRLEIPTEQLKKIIKDLKQHDLVEYDEQTGEIKLASWLLNIEKEAEKIKPATGTIILPKNQEITIQGVAIGNFTDKDLELNVRLKAKLKEIAICNIG